MENDWEKFLAKLMKEYDFSQNKDGDYVVPCRFNDFYDDGTLRGKFKGTITVEAKHCGAEIHATCYTNGDVDPEAGGFSVPDAYTMEERERSVRTFLERYGAEKAQNYGQISLF